MSIADVVPAKLVLQRTFQHAEHLPVHVVLGYTEKQESADDPAEASGEDPSYPWGQQEVSTDTPSVLLDAAPDIGISSRICSLLRERIVYLRPNSNPDPPC